LEIYHHITKKLLEPNNFLGGANKGTVLGVSAIESNTSLPFPIPGNTKIPQQNAKTSS